MLSGILLIDKPINWTSHDCVSRTRKIIDQRKVGHAGTLDPMATGLLVLLLGNATKLFEQCSISDKCYQGGITLGVDTDTFDFEGKILQNTHPEVFAEHTIHTAMKSLKGEQTQTVPNYSAVRINGTRSHWLARSNIEFTPIEKKVMVHEFDCLRYTHPEIYFEALVERGTYIRSLAFDMGRALNCASSLSMLRRISSGFFHINQAFTFSQIEQMSIDAIRKIAESQFQDCYEKIQSYQPSR